MTTALLVMTNGRDELLTQTLASFFERTVRNDVGFVLIHDDSGDQEHFKKMVALVDTDLIPVNSVHVHTTGSPLGFGGAIRNAWSLLAEHYVRYDGFDWVVHLEDDFTFNRTVDLRKVREVLTDCPYLAQMAFKRQPWGSDAGYANGFMEAVPDAYVEHEEEWVETRRNWTTNPSLFRAELLVGGWPEDPFSEGKYGFVLKEHGLPWGVEGNEVQFGIWGRIEDPPLVHHIGDYRIGTGY